MGRPWGWCWGCEGREGAASETWRLQNKNMFQNPCYPDESACRFPLKGAQEVWRTFWAGLGWKIEPDELKSQTSPDFQVSSFII